MNLTVQHVDDHLFVVDKPPGLLAQADHTGDPDVLTLGKEWLGAREGGEPFLGLVHRLDRPASGVMVLGRTSAAARDLSRQFRERLVEKRYLALVEGSLTGLGACIDYIAKPGRHPRIVAPDDPEGMRARLTWQALARDGGKSLLQVQLQTGRPHQIRLQLSERGHPVVGDVRYGATTPLDGRNCALHHALLRLEHPESQRLMTFTASLPGVWDAVLTDRFRAALDRLQLE